MSDHWRGEHPWQDKPAVPADPPSPLTAEEEADAIVDVARDMVRQAVDWYEVLLDALCASDNGNNPFYADDNDTIALANELALVVRERLALGERRG